MTGTGLLLRAFLRRDRWILLAWIVGDWLLYYSQAVSVEGLYPTQASLDRAAAELGGNTAFVALAGPARALDTVGGQTMWQAGAFGAVVAGLMTMVVVGRHTRGEEESGRDELVRAAPVGRFATTTAATLEASMAALVLGGLVTASLAAYGLPFAGSQATGLGLTVFGLVATGIALVSCQLTVGIRSAYGLTGAVLAASYLLRAVGDVTGGALSWLSPIGWYQSLRPYADEQWWPLALSGLTAIALVALAGRLLRHRDHGAGLLPARPGPAGGRLGAFGLAWRLQRGTLVGWALGSLVLGLSLGSVGDQAGDVVGDSGFSGEVFGGDPQQGYYAVVLVMLGILAGAYAVSATLRLRADEDDGRSELLLSTALTRRRWAGSHLLLVIAGALLVVLLGGGGMAVSYLATTRDGATAWRILAGGIATLAPVAVLVGASLLLYGVSRRLALAAWALVAWCLVALLFARSLRLPGWLAGLSPYDHLRLVPAEPFAATPVVVEAVLAFGLLAVGLQALRRRDLG